MKVKVYIGIGGWKVHTEVDLIACPHVGDMIVVRDTTVTCERVYIDTDHVQVRETIRFNSEANLEDYIKMGWER